MTNERINRRIERLLDQLEEAADIEDWETVQRLSRQVVALDRENAGAAAFLEMAGDMRGRRWTPDEPVSPALFIYHSQNRPNVFV